MVWAKGRATVRARVKITENFSFLPGEEIKDIANQEQTAYFVTTYNRLFVTGKLYEDDIFYDGGDNHQYTNIPVNITYLLDLQYGETIEATHDIFHSILFVTSSNRKISIGTYHAFTPQRNYHHFVADVTEYFPVEIKDTGYYGTLMVLDTTNQLHAIGTTTMATATTYYPVLLDFVDIETFECITVPDEDCVGFTTLTNITELYHLGYQRIHSVIQPFESLLQFTSEYVELGTLVDASTFDTMPMRHLHLIEIE